MIREARTLGFEVLYVLSGEGEQMLDDRETFRVSGGNTRNTGWQTMRLLAVYSPGGPEKALEGLPDFRELPAGAAPAWSRT